jgi:hypothetical protein
MTDNSFRLSRVYAEGWNAANNLTADECDRLNPAQMAALNPYAADPEKSRWNEGFAAFLK